MSRPCPEATLSSREPTTLAPRDRHRRCERSDRRTARESDSRRPDSGRWAVAAAATRCRSHAAGNLRASRGWRCRGARSSPSPGQSRTACRRSRATDGSLVAEGVAVAASQRTAVRIPVVAVTTRILVAQARPPALIHAVDELGVEAVVVERGAPPSARILLSVLAQQSERDRICQSKGANITVPNDCLRMHGDANKPSLGGYLNT